MIGQKEGFARKFLPSKAHGDVRDVNGPKMTLAMA
jgi:hypothetical protein